MKFNRLLIIFILIISQGIVWGNDNIPERDGPFSVIKVVDGDTIVLSINEKKTKVRLIGVDTPETVHPKKPVEAYGREASEFTKNLLKGEQVTLEYEPGPSKLDKYRRLLAYVYRYPDGFFVNLEIVRQGYGYAYTRYPFQYMEKFRFYERKAREAEKGLWAVGDFSTEEKEKVKTKTSEKKENYYVASKNSNKYHCPSCRWAKKIKAKNLIRFKSKAEAENRGYKGCGVCRP